MQHFNRKLTKTCNHLSGCKKYSVNVNTYSEIKGRKPSASTNRNVLNLMNNIYPKRKAVLSLRVRFEKRSHLTQGKELVTKTTFI